MIAGGLLGIFVPIFLYQLFDFNLRYVIYYYLIGHSLYGLTVAWGAKYLNKIGLRRSLKISIIWGSLYYLCFYFLDKYVGVDSNFLEHKNLIILLISLVIFTLTINRLLYWLPLHTDLAKFTNKRNRGKELSLMEATTVVIKSILPLVSGVILALYSYDILFLIAIIIYLLGFIPFAALPRTKERFSWGYLETWKEFFSKKRRRAIYAYMGDGAENAVGIIFWPIFIWEILNGNYFEVGALTSLIVVISIILQLIIGKFIDSKDKSKLIKYGSVFYSIGWIIKIFIATAFQIFITSTYHNLTKIFTRTPFDTLYYESAADQGHFVDEYTVIHEMAVQFGKVIILLFALVLVPYFSIQWIFLLAAISSLFINFLVSNVSEKKQR